MSCANLHLEQLPIDCSEERGAEGRSQDLVETTLAPLANYLRHEAVRARRRVHEPIERGG